MNGKTEKTFAEFFAGIGLMRIGLERAGWRITFANDIDDDKWQMYRDHFGDTGEFVVGDVHHLDVDTVPHVALATASFPCNNLRLPERAKGLPVPSLPHFGVSLTSSQKWSAADRQWSFWKMLPAS